MLCSKFGDDRSKAGLTMLAVVAGWTDTGRTDAKVNLYSVQCCRLHWTDNNTNRKLGCRRETARQLCISFSPRDPENTETNGTLYVSCTPSSKSQLLRGSAAHESYAKLGMNHAIYV